ncbi:MAG: hypothetical protein QMD96_00585 [Anaerosomatales bacterium]|nr:hypothetical protein [Anaerosomatales bacterium]
MKDNARQRRAGTTTGVAGAVRGGVLAGLVVVLLAGAALVYLRLSGQQLPFERARELDRVLVVVALPDENGDVVAQCIAVADLARGTVSSIDPSTRVTIPGTTYSSLRDAYPFGGGDGVARAVAGLRGEEPMPWIALGPDAVFHVLGRTGQFGVQIDEPMSVFDGERLYEFPAGIVMVGTVKDLRAVLNGSAYLSPSARRHVLESVAAGFVKAFASYKGGIGTAVEAGVIESDLTPEEANGAARRMAGLRRE